MVFWINHPNFDYNKKRTMLGIIIVLMSSAWLPISKEIFFGIMNTVIYGGVQIGHLVSLLGVIGAWAIYKRWF